MLAELLYHLCSTHHMTVPHWHKETACWEHHCGWRMCIPSGSEVSLLFLLSYWLLFYYMGVGYIHWAFQCIGRHCTEVYSTWHKTFSPSMFAANQSPCHESCYLFWVTNGNNASAGTVWSHKWITYLCRMGFTRCVPSHTSFTIHPFTRTRWHGWVVRHPLGSIGIVGLHRYLLHRIDIRLLGRCNIRARVDEGEIQRTRCITRLDLTWPSAQRATKACLWTKGFAFNPSTSGWYCRNLKGHLQKY